MFKEMKPVEKELMQRIEDILHDYTIPKQSKGEHVRKAFDDFYANLSGKTGDILFDIAAGDVVKYKGRKYVVLYTEIVLGGNCKEVCLVESKRGLFGFIKPISLYDEEIMQLMLWEDR